MADAHGVLDDLPILRFLPPDTRSLVVGSFATVAFPFGTVIAHEGAAADALHVIVSGRARVLKRGEHGDEVPLGFLRAGDSVGEVEILQQTAHPTTVRASSDVLALRLPRQVFDTLITTHGDIRTYLELQVKHRKLQTFFRDFPAFGRLPPEAVVGVVLAEFESVMVEAGQTVFREGDPPGPVYLVEEGRARAYVGRDGTREFLRAYGRGDYFGELSAYGDTPRSATVEAVTPCRMLTMSAEAFRRLVGSLPELRSQIEERLSSYRYKSRADVPHDIEHEILPSAAEAPPQVAPDQVDETAEHHEAEGPFVQKGRFLKRGRRIRRFPFVQQIDEMDCGAASLAMVCRHFGRSVRLSRIRQLVNTGLDGTSLRAICSAATELGLAARSVKASARHLDQMPLPAIVHWDGDHWLVVYHVGRRHVAAADPALGLRRFPREEFIRRWTGYAALFDYTPALAATPESPSSLAWLWPFVAPFRNTLLQALGLAVVVSLLQMVLPVFTQVIVDRVLVEQDLRLLNLLIVAMAVTMGFIVVALGVQRYLLSFVAARVDTATLDHLMRHLLSLPLPYFLARRTGDIQRRLEGVRLVRDAMVQHGVAGITAVGQLAVTVALMFVYSQTLALVFLATAPLYALLMRLAVRRLRPALYDLEDAYSRYHSYQIDAIKGIETVKALAGEPAFRNLMLQQFHHVARRSFKADFTVMAYQAASQALGFLALGLFLWAGAHQVMDGQLTIGGLVAFNSLVALSQAPIENLLQMWDDVQRATVLINRLNDVFDQEPEQGANRERLKPVRHLAGHVTFRNVGFRYGGPEAPPILEGITVEIPAGRTVAIVGRSGSGKTTLAKCLSGLLEPTEGTILFDGIDQQTISYRELRRQIGYVLQDNYLFSDTIARNIAFGEDEHDMDRVRWAAQMANADEFVERLPFGYDTRVGETGLSISVGQRQRIAIARAIYHKPPVIVLDEATSALDSESERRVKQNLEIVLRGRTSFVIAHRLSTVQAADVILVLDRGRLVERGTHDELLKRQGLYYYLLSQQLGVDA